MDYCPRFDAAAAVVLQPSNSSSKSKYRSNTKMDGRNNYQNGQSNLLKVRLPFFLVHHLANSTASWWHGDDQN